MTILELQPLSFQVSADEHTWRLDLVLTARYPDISRSRWQSAIKDGAVTVNGASCKPKTPVNMGDWIVAQLVIEEQTSDSPEDIPLNIVYQDQDIIVIDKAAGLVVHPAAGNHRGTLLNALLHHFPNTACLPRAGIVHRLDKDTSGLMVVAHSLRAHQSLVEQLQMRTMGRTYLALVHRYLTAGGTIDAPIGRHQHDRLRMSLRPDGKSAITHYRIEARFKDLTLLRVQLETGRTHQIRVHMASIKHPIVGDKLYGQHSWLPKNAPDVVKSAIHTFPRQALHAHELRLHHPHTQEALSFTSPLPTDMHSLLDTLTTHAPESDGL